MHKIVDETHTMTLFETNNVIVKMIFDEIIKFDNDGCVEDLFSLYILLRLSKFLLPNRMGIVHSGLFSVLEDLRKLNRFNWGIVVYEYLVDSLCSTSMSIRNESSQSHIPHCWMCVLITGTLKCLWLYNLVDMCNIIHILLTMIEIYNIHGI